MKIRNMVLTGKACPDENRESGRPGMSKGGKKPKLNKIA
jgi:hypothetical protein